MDDMNTASLLFSHLQVYFPLCLDNPLPSAAIFFWGYNALIEKTCSYQEV